MEKAGFSDRLDPAMSALALKDIPELDGNIRIVLKHDVSYRIGDKGGYVNA